MFYLCYLTSRGHKVLMFSQMTRMLDIIQDYLGYRGCYFPELVVHSLDQNSNKTDYVIIHEIYYKIHILAVSIPGKCNNRIRFMFSSQDIPTNGWMVLSGGRSAIWQFKISTKQKIPLYFSWVHGQVGTVLMSHLCILSSSLATETSLLVQSWVAPATSLTHLKNFSLNFWYLSFAIRVNLHP